MAAQVFRLKRNDVEAVQFDGENGDEISRWVGWMTAYAAEPGPGMYVTTRDGIARLGVGDWLTKDALSGLQVFKADVFEAAFEPVPAPEQKSEAQR